MALEPYTYTRRKFDAAYEEMIRGLTHPNGRGNASLNPEEDAKMLLQDKLLEAEITIGRTTGIAAEFRWKSGRKDVYVVVDLPEEQVAPHVIAQREAFIQKMKGEYNAH